MLSAPDDYSRIKVVHSFEELLETPLADGINGLCWQRELPGDFGAVITALRLTGDVMPLEAELLRAMPLSQEGKTAAAAMLEDLRRLEEHGLAPTLECVREYPRDDGPVPTDVYSFHVDSAPVQADTWLCTYFGPPGEGLRNDQAQRRVDVAATRAALLKLHGGKDDDGFGEFLRAGCYDLHYTPVAGARPFSFGVGHLWRIAVQYPGSPVPPCIHRAPDSPGPRLLLIS